MGYQTKAYDMGNILKTSRTKRISHVTSKNVSEFQKLKNLKKSTLRVKKVNVSIFAGNETSSNFELGTRNRIPIGILLLSEKGGYIWLSRQFPNSKL